MEKDILQLEDDIDTAILFWRYFERNRDPNKGTLITKPTLCSFIDGLTLKPEATRFILDGNFPEEEWGPTDFLLPVALDFLRTQAQKIEKIIIYSAEDLEKLKSAIPRGIENMSITIISKWWTMGIAEIIKEILAD